MKKTYKLISAILSLAILFSLASGLCLSASAATSSKVADAITENLPIVTYAMPSSGAARVYSYSSSSLSTQTKQYYIDTYTDQIVITKISANGKAIYVYYPSTSSSTGYRSRWFKTDDILGLSKVSISSLTATAKKTTYRMSSARGVTSYGYIAKGDSVVRLGTHTSINSTSYRISLYPISNCTVNRVSNVRHKIALERVSSQTGGQALSYETKYSSSTGFNYLTSLDGKSMSDYSSVFYSYNSSGTSKSTSGNYNTYRYVKVGSSYKDVGACQCYGYARYLQIKLFGVNEFTSSGSFTKKYKNTGANYSADTLQTIVENCGVGAHIRTNTSGHSLVILAYNSEGLTTADANSDGANGIRVKTWSYSEFVAKYAPRGIAYVAVYTG